MAHARAAQQVSERRACRVIGQARATQRYVPRESPNERALVARLVALASRFGRYGYRRVTALLRQEGWRVNHKRVERLWRQEGLKVPAKQPKRGRLWLADGSIVRRRAGHRDHVWAYDFVFDRTADGRKLRLLTIVDEYTRECLAVDVARRLNSQDVVGRQNLMRPTDTHDANLLAPACVPAESRAPMTDAAASRFGAGRTHQAPASDAVR